MIRRLHIQAAPTQSLLARVPAPSSSADVPYAQRPLFTALGTPPQLLQVHLPPSMPVAIQAASLISLSHIASTSVTPLFDVKRLLWGKKWRYQSIESTAPAQLLVKGKGLYVLTLDGLTDYALFPRDALLSYAGAALRVSTVKNTASGLAQYGYSLLQGRGDAVVQSAGEVHKLVLQAGEDVVVKNSCLVGLSMSGKLEGIDPYLFHGPPQPETAVETTELVPTQSYSFYLHKALAALHSVKQYIARLVSGSHGYVKISGPRTILLQSPPSSSPSFFQTQQGPISIIENQLATAAKSTNPVDYLHYATVVNGEVKFTSTPDFRATVDKLTKKET